MAGIAAAILGAGAIGAGASIFGSLTQKNATNKAIAAQQAEFGVAQQAEQPFISAGQEAAGTLSGLLRPGADMSSILQNIPGMKFLQQLTQQGVSNQATTTGLSGNTLLAGANAGNNIALNAGWLPIVSSLQGLISSGAGAAGALGGQAVQTGGQIGGNIVGGANAIAGGATAAGAGIGNSLTSAALFSKLLNPNNNMYGATSGASAANTGAPGGGYFDINGQVQAGPGYYA